MKTARVVATSLLAGIGLARAQFPDCDKVNMSGDGPFGRMVQHNATADDGTLVFVFHPPAPASAAYPVMVFSHGSTGEWAMYEQAFIRYVSHGFVVVFPLIKGPEADTHALTTDPMGGFTMKGLRYAAAANANASSPLHGMLDLDNVVLAGHSMGASSTIMAARKLPAGSAKVAVAQHPGICGPFGPPPCLGPGPLCNTWMPADFDNVTSKMPILLTTATNDGAFWPAPHTAEHELGCFHKATDSSKTKDSTAFAQFSATACADDGKGGRYNRKWSDGGHDCPMNHQSVETRWVLTAAKLYTHVGGAAASKCHAMLWGQQADSLQKDPAVEKFVINAPVSTAEPVVV